MVFTRVEIWRGVVLTKQKLIECMDILFGEHKENEDIDDMIFNINREIGCQRIQVEKFAKCCHDQKNACAILGARLVYYWRESFDFKYVKSSELDIVQKIQQERPSQYICCGCLLESEFENYEEKITEENEMRRRCGFRYSCDSCIQTTTNGSYPVDDIASKIVECTTYCFYCNQDKCGKQTHNDLMSFVDHGFPAVNKRLGVFERKVDNFVLIDIQRA